jgi:predicted double-glycine peptidase
MPVHEDLSVSYHQQDTDYYCGAACAQMVLDQIGAGLLDQNNLYNENHRQRRRTRMGNWPGRFAIHDECPDAAG